MTSIFNVINMEVTASEGEFNAALWKRFQKGKVRNVYPKSKYDDIIQKIKSMEDNPPVNSPGEYYLLRKFVVTKIDNIERLACKNEPGMNCDESGNKVKFYIALEEIHSYIDKAHRTTKHGGRDKIVRILQQQGIVNVTRDTVELFLSFCQICGPRRKETVKRFAKVTVQSNCNGNITVEDSITIEQSDSFRETIKTEADVENSRCNSVVNHDIVHLRQGLIAVLDFVESPDGDYNYVMLYVDYPTDFCILRPMKCKCVHEMVNHLLDICTFIGPPHILHSDSNDSNLLIFVLQELKRLWHECVIVHNAISSADEELQIIIEKCVHDIREMLEKWMIDNNSRRWSFALRFVQLRWNTKMSDHNGKTPYENFFGKALHLVPVNPNLLSQINGQKKDLNKRYKNNEEECEHLQVSVDPNVCSLVQNNMTRNQSHLSPSLQQCDTIIDTSMVKMEPVYDEYEEQNLVIDETSADSSHASVNSV